MRVVCITATGGRPEAFALCAHYMERQGVPFRWIVLDDCDPATVIPARCDYLIRPTWRWAPGQNTQAANMVALIDAALAQPFDLLLVIEDDEWYAPDYVLAMMQVAALGFDMFGQSDAHFYNVRLRQARVLPNKEHTALCRSGMNRAGALTMRQTFCETPPKGMHQDRVMWDRTAPNRKSCFTQSRPLNVGIKGMPGRGGLGTGHDRIKRDRLLDPRLQLLTEWIGADAPFYRKYYQP